MLESSNTAIQVHLQLKPDDFVRKHKIAQAIATPVLAISYNSSFLLERACWYKLE